MTMLSGTTVLSLPLATDEPSGAAVPLLMLPMAEGTGVLAFSDEAVLAGHVPPRPGDQRRPAAL